MLGEYYHTIDAKRRIQLPVELRKSLGDAVAVTCGFDQQLDMRPWNIWEKKVKEEYAKLSANKRDRDLARFLHRGKKVKIDNSGRILVPDNFAAFAGLKDNVVLVNVFDKVEIWDEARWNKYVKELEPKAPQLAEEADIGL